MTKVDKSCKLVLIINNLVYQYQYLKNFLSKLNNCKENKNVALILLLNDVSIISTREKNIYKEMF